MRSISGQLPKELVDSIGDKSVASADAHIVHNQISGTTSFHE